jgi:hypothetical protein
VKVRTKSCREQPIPYREVTLLTTVYGASRAVLHACCRPIIGFACVPVPILVPGLPRTLAPFVVTVVVVGGMGVDAGAGAAT